jgi:hypothetical protein
VTPARSWILGAALGCFAAGLAVGLTVPRALAGDSEAVSPEVDYVRELADTYSLTAEQQRSIRLVLQSARKEEMAVRRSIEVNQLPPQIQSRLLAVRSHAEQRIRAVLDADQRVRYDEDSRPSRAGSADGK